MKPTNDKPTKDECISDEKLMMVFFKEAKQQEVDDCLKNDETCRRLDQLEADMNAIEQAQSQPDLPEDYGQQLWNQISEKLVIEPVKGHSKNISWLEKLKNLVLMPQYSLASFAVVVGLVAVAFYAGRQQNDHVLGIDLQEQLLAQNIQLHLTQSEIFLTQVSNDNGSYNNQAMAQRLLSSNRIFKQALAKHEGQFTTQLLQDLEPILLEYANDSDDTKSSQGIPNQSHGQQPQANWVNDSISNNLMFQIKAMKQKLAQENDII